MEFTLKPAYPATTPGDLYVPEILGNIVSSRPIHDFFLDSFSQQFLTWLPVQLLLWSLFCYYLCVFLGN